MGVSNFELKEDSMGFQFESKANRQTTQHKSTAAPKKTILRFSPTHPDLRLQRSFGNQGVLHLQSRSTHRAVDLPRTGEWGEEAIDAPPGNGGGKLAPKAPSGTCDTPTKMEAVTSGAFKGRKKMSDYYPKLSYWGNDAKCGPWKTGSYVGSNVQLVGTIPATCKHSNFKFEQTVTYTKARFNGVKHAKEGVVQDDIKKSGRDFSTPPERQVWNRYVTMADPPAIAYTSYKNVEFDRSFVTSLTGPKGKMSVNWNTSIRVTKRKVTQNTIS